MALTVTRVGSAPAGTIRFLLQSQAATMNDVLKSWFHRFMSTEDLPRRSYCPLDANAKGLLELACSGYVKVERETASLKMPDIKEIMPD